MLSVLMSTINNFFVEDKIVVEKSFEDEKQTSTFASTSAYYEAKCDYILQRKFPSSARFLIRIGMIFSEMMILIILIVQGGIVAS
jgi:hypothetical protein